MRHTYVLLCLFAFISSLLVGCNLFVDNSKANKERHSPYFEQIVFDQSGEFAGLNLGDSREAVLGSLPAKALDEEYEDYVYYYWLLDDIHDYYLDLYFGENDQLESIDAYVYFYEDDYDYDTQSAQAFYQDMVDILTTKYGEGEGSDGDDYVYWYFDDKDVEVGIDEGEVYFYAYTYSDYDDEYSTEISYSSYEEIILNTLGDYGGLSLGNSKDFALEILPEEGLENEDDYLYYSWLVDEKHDCYLDLYFEDNLLSDIISYSYFYNDNDEEDSVMAEIFYVKMVDMLTAKYGKGIDEGDGYTYWEAGEEYMEIARYGNEVSFYGYDETYYSYDYDESEYGSSAEMSFSDFEEILFEKSGDLIGLRLGDSKQAVTNSMPNDALEDVYDDDLYYYYWIVNNMHDYYLDLYFNDNDELEGINVYAYFYDENFDSQAEIAKYTFNKVSDMMTSLYGESERERGSYIWKMDGYKRAEVSLSNNELYLAVYNE